MATGNTINIAITGVGGQGVLTLAEILAKTALAQSYNVRVGEIHGMAQRGGHVVCSVRIGDDALGPIIDAGSADLVVGFEPIETLREVYRIRKDGQIIMSTYVQYPVEVSMGKMEYPSQDEILTQIRRHTSKIAKFDAMKLAKEAGSPRSLNMVMFGAIIGSHLTPIEEDTALNIVNSFFQEKFQSINTKAVKLGLAEIQNHL